MIARIVENNNGDKVLLCKNGTIIADITREILLVLFKRFHLAHTLTGEDGMWNDVSNEMSLYPGTTLVCVTDDRKLVIEDPEIFLPLLGENSEAYIHYITTAEYAEKHDRSPEIIKLLCRQGRISGAVKRGNVWNIPEDAPYPIEKGNRRK